MDIKSFKKLPIMGILRGTPPSGIKPLVKAIMSSGLKTIEVAMNSPSAGKIIKEIKAQAGRNLNIGAGTVLTMDD